MFVGKRYPAAPVLSVSPGIERQALVTGVVDALGQLAQLHGQRLRVAIGVTLAGADPEPPGHQKRLVIGSLVVQICTLPERLSLKETLMRRARSVPLQGITRLSLDGQQTDLTLGATGGHLVQAGQAGLRQPQRRTAGTHLEPASGRHLEVTRGTRRIATSPQVLGEVAGMTADPGGMTRFDHLDHPLVQDDTHVLRTGKIGCLLQQRMRELEIVRIGFAGLDDLQPPHLLQRGLESTVIDFQTVAQHAGFELPAKDGCHVSNLAVALQLIDTAGQQPQ